MTTVMFVCHGNICRSTMAEFVLKHLVKERGVADEFVIASAATHRDEIGSDTHQGTKRKLREMGIATTPRRAVQLIWQDYMSYDHILGADSANIRTILRIVDGDEEGKVRRLLEVAGESRDIADPWHTGNFDETYEDVLAGCRALLVELGYTL